MKKLRHYIEAFFTLLAYVILRLLPLRAASALGGWVARLLGPSVRVHRVADFNLSVAMPELTPQQRQQILLRMWDNLGRVFAEYPHLGNAALHQSVTVIKGLEHFKRYQGQQMPVLLISGHIGNWELLGPIAFRQGMPLHLLYRAANNPVANRLVAMMRKPFSLGLHAKGREGARAVLAAMKKAEPVAMLVDQKTNDGLSVSFFGHEAMTSTAVAQLVQHFDVVVLPAFCKRIEGVQFEMEVLPPLSFKLSGDEAADCRIITQQINQLLEERIKQDPAQWFWVHKRWPHSKKQTLREAL